MPEFKFNGKLYYNPVEFALDRIGGTWKMPILWRIKDEPLRYSELRKKLPRISDRMLALQLRELEEEGFVIRKVFPEVPVRVVYRLSPRGKRALKVVSFLRDYGLQLMKEFDIDEKKLKQQRKEN